MKVSLIKWANVVEYASNDQEMRKAFSKFYAKLKLVQWERPNDILKTFNSADIINCPKGNRVVFNIGGNKYRLVCGYHFSEAHIFLFIKFVGTHREYDQINICTINMFSK